MDIVSAFRKVSTKPDQVHPKGQVTTYTYNLDDALQQIVYANATIATPSVSYTYDPAYARRTTMLDGTGTTTYTYHAPGTMGATRAATVDGQLTNDTIAYAYDELGRAVSRSLNGVAATWSYDALGRVTTEGNVLGTFTYAYNGVSARLASVTYPNGQTSVYTYFNHAGDDRLQTIHHRKPDAATLSKIDYTYDAAGNILTLQQQADSAAPTVYQYTYDRADQLTGAVHQTTAPTPTILKRFAYGYDLAGNRTSEQIDDAVTSASYDSLNRLTSQQSGGALVFKGIVSESANVTIQGQPALVDSSNRFTGSVLAPSGTTSVVISATDGSANTSFATFEVDQASTNKTLAYDANGNLTSDGTRTFEWDVRNQLLAVNVGTHRTEFTYDGLQRRVRTLEKDNGIVQSDTWVIWCENEVCEERGADGVSVTRRSFANGTQTNGAASFFVTDHLGSVTESTDAASTLLARYTYDPYGRRTLVAGSDVSELGFTGHHWQASGDVWLTMYRAYDPGLGRWLTLDPSGSPDGPNRYAYAVGNPINAADPLGLSVELYCVPIGEGGSNLLRRALGALGAKHCFVRVKCDNCTNKYDQRLEITGETPDHQAIIAPPQPFSADSGTKAKILPPDNDSKDCKNEDCIQKAYRVVQATGRSYSVRKRNSNTLAEDLLAACGMKAVFPFGIIGNR